MNRIVRGGLALCIGFGVTLVAIKVADNRTDPQPPGTALGSVDFGRYCSAMYGKASVARLDTTKGAYGWRCWTTVNDLISYADIDVGDACEQAYGAPAYDETTNVADPYSWQCYRGPPQG